MTDSGLWDWRGAPISAQVQGNDRVVAHAEGADLSGADFSDMRLHRLYLERCSARKTAFSGAAIQGGAVRDTELDAVDLRGAFLGQDAVHFTECTFVRVNARDVQVFNCTWSGVTFRDCSMTGIDFNASRFEGVAFYGKYRDLTFRRTWPPALHARYGPPAFDASEPEIDFREALLSWVVFRGGISLSKVHVARDRGQVLVPQWQAALSRAENTDLSEDATALVRILAQDVDQDEYLIMPEDVLAYCGPEEGHKLLRVLGVTWE